MRDTLIIMSSAMSNRPPVPEAIILVTLTQRVVSFMGASQMNQVTK